MFFVFPALGQISSNKSTVCTDEVVKQISSRGINIGASINDIVTLFAVTETEKQTIIRGYSNPAKDGYRFFSVYPNQNPQKPDEKFAGITDYLFEFLDDRLTVLSVTYSKPIWENTRQFTETMAEIFNLPSVEKWTSQPNETIELQCGNYMIKMQTNNSSIGRSSMTVYDTRINQILQDRKRKASNEQLREELKTFKP